MDSIVEDLESQDMDSRLEQCEPLKVLEWGQRLMTVLKGTHLFVMGARTEAG